MKPYQARLYCAATASGRAKPMGHYVEYLVEVPSQLVRGVAELLTANAHPTQGDASTLSLLGGSRSRRSSSPCFSSAATSSKPRTERPLMKICGTVRIPVSANNQSRQS